MAKCGIRGSPPLARGTVFVCNVFIPWQGITPACAGNSLISFDDAVNDEDHPRLRGEQLLMVLILLRMEGSPPLARGTA